MDTYASVSLAEKTLHNIELRRMCWADTVKRAPHYKGSVNVIQSDTFKEKKLESNTIPKQCVMDVDSLRLCGKIIKNYGNVLLINQACYTNKGGGVDTGDNTTEAELCRRTNFRKALKRVDPKAYPLKNGTIIYCDKVTVIKDDEYNILDDTFDIGIASIALPNRPSVIISNNKDIYELESNKAITEKTIKKTLKLAKQCEYKSIVFNHIGMSSKHPVDDFIDILKKSLIGCGIDRVFIIQSSGSDDNPEFENERLTWIKFCKTLDNVTKNLQKCEEPQKMQIKIHKRHKRDLKKSLGDNYDIEDENGERNYKQFETIYKKIENESSEEDESESEHSDSESEHSDSEFECSESYSESCSE